MSYTLITGASSGIGYELAWIFAKNGHDLVLVARQKNKLAELSQILKKKFAIKILIISFDLSLADAASEIFRKVQGHSISVNYLVNNAGFYIKGHFFETSWEEEQKLLMLQCLSHTQLVKLFLPDMLKLGSGGILNVGSTDSFVPGPYNAIYCAAKCFVLNFSEAIAEEVSGSGITVTTLCPGGTKTNFQEYDNRGKSKLFPVMKASEVAAIGYSALMKGKRIVIPGTINRLQVFFTRFLPRKFVTRITGSIIEKQQV